MEPAAKLLTIVVPVYNEAASVGQTLARLLKTDLDIPFEVIVVDDGSTDDSATIMRRLADGDGVVRLVRHERNLGKGAAVRTGIEAANGDLLTILDADLELEPASFRELIPPIVDGEADVAYGVRLFSRSAISFWAVAGNRIVSLWTSLLFNTWIADVESCFKVASIELWRSLDLRSNGFGFEAECTAKFLRRRLRVYQAPIAYRARGKQDGKKIRWTDGVTALWILLRVRVFGA